MICPLCPVRNSITTDPNKLGIVVTSPEHLRHVLGIAQAALRAGKGIKVFLTGKAVHLTKCAEFSVLAGMCAVDDLAICADSYACEGYDVADIPHGISCRQMRTQAFLGAILAECGRYVVL